MSKCKSVENDLPLYLDDLLSTADKKEVEEHLESCPQCTKALIQLNKTKMMAQSLARVEPPPWLKQKTMAGVREQAEKKSFVQKWFYPVRVKIPVQIMATLVITVLAVYIYRSGDEQMKSVLPPRASAPVIESQQDQLQEQKIKMSSDQAIQKEDQVTQKKEAPRAEVRARTVDAVRDAKGQVPPDIKDGKYVVARDAETAAPSAAALERKKESYALGASMNQSEAPQEKIIMPRANIILRVTNADTAYVEAENILHNNEAKKIIKQTPDGKIFISAEIKAQKIKDVIAQLKKVGQVEEDGMPAANAAGNISVLIEISDN
jgi:hypothetical protein